MTGPEQKADDLVQELLDTYNGSRANRGTWYLWRFRDKRTEVVELLAKAFTSTATIKFSQIPTTHSSDPSLWDDDAE